MYNSNEQEQEILKFWEKDKTFEKSVSERPENKPYVFYDGPPFATGLPHYGHILSSVIKDVVPRYWTMKGYRVRRRWGWDCHGMPIENLVEKELKISGKKQIEALGVDKFNETCRSKVLTYTHEWKKMVDRVGRWVEFDNAYKTMDPTYMESVWWALKTIWDKGLIYEGRKVLMYCPRCETPVSKAEIAMDNSYKDIEEETVTVEFKVKNPERYGLPTDTYILAWTTTPWTLPGNVALAVGDDIEYVVCQTDGAANSYICAKDRAEVIFGDSTYRIERTIKGSSLVGIEYEPLFNIPAIVATGKKAWYVTSADFVTTEEGTGVVHTAVVYGEDDYNLGLKVGLPVVPLLDSKGIFNEEAPSLIQGQYFKKAEKIIKEDLEARGILFKKENFIHSYPHCWRCDTQLFYNAISAWFIDIQRIKGRLIELNQKINWFPEHLKEGRFLNILETAPDWNISRNRYWATPLPFWKCECGHTMCIGSVQELKEKVVNFTEVYKTNKVEEMDLHKHLMDKLKIKCDKCGQKVNRISEVIDCWVESASMPFAEFHYPFENKELFENRFPGEYIGEYIAQTRAWFYYMHAMATLLFDEVSFKNVVCTGTILNEKGEKLSKSKMNYTDPWAIIGQYGADALRYYLMTSVVMEADNLYFNDREVKEVYNKVINILWNVVVFYQTYGGEYNKEIKANESESILDKWILAKLNLLLKEVTEQMDNYNTVKAGRPIKDFIDDLSTWYLRRSRDRFKGGDEQDKQNALATMHTVLLTLAKVMAPFTPFIAEKVWLELSSKKTSVHLEAWPKVDRGLINEKLLAEMVLARKVVELGLAARAEAGIKVKQPLQYICYQTDGLSEQLERIVAEELNVKEVRRSTEIRVEKNLIVKDNANVCVGLNTIISEELRNEGLAREFIRLINLKRKELNLTVSDRAVVFFRTDSVELQQAIASNTAEISRRTLVQSISLTQDLVGVKEEVGDSAVVVKVERP